MVEDTFSGGGAHRQLRPATHQDQTRSVTATLALPPSDTAAAPTYRSRFARESALSVSKGGKGQLQAAATAEPTERQRTS